MQRAAKVGNAFLGIYKGTNSSKFLFTQAERMVRPRLQKSATTSSRSIHTSSADQGPTLAVKPYYSPRIEQALLPRRQALTAKETRTLDEMFASVFNAARQQEHVHGGPTQEAKWTPKEMAERLSTKPMEVRWTRAADSVLDMKKEEIELCKSDHELYTWAVESLFSSLIDTSSASPSHSSEASSSDMIHEEETNIPAFAYPQLLAVIMRTFRTKYQDPHVALALFDYARQASPTSYVTCCGTAAYNELIETKWESFHDLQGVSDIIEEMNLNKVRIDTRTTKLVENLRREVGERRFWQEEGFGESQTGVMNLLGRIERACWPEASKMAPHDYGRPKSSTRWKIDSEAWKRPTPREHDGLEFV